MCTNFVHVCLDATSKAGGNVVIAKFAAELKDEGFRFLSVAQGGVATEATTDMLGCKSLHDSSRCAIEMSHILSPPRQS